MSERFAIVSGWRQCAVGLVGSLLVACAGPSGYVPIDDRSRGGQAARAQARAAEIPASGLHTVRRGETLYQIAFRYGTDWQTVAGYNNLRSPYTIYPGQNLRVAPGNGSPRVAAVAPPPKQPSPPPSRPTNSVPATRAIPAPTPAQSAPAKTAGTISVPAKVSRWDWPTDGPLISRFQSGTSLNKGIDIAGTLGQPIKAAADGAVVYAGRGLIGYGDMIIVKHDDTFLSAYAHNSKLMVSEGDQVKRGQVIAEMGSSGTDRVKLHFEIRQRGKPVDPLGHLPKR
ncbi:lipoprotein NlpD [Halopseudomonas xinjiangensis]|uniref:Lipoprotein NlpD n=1 Tax=Halopseudomonas xinjiangensis TaxID=487184 RepID=A0A1H1N020_9GAMM|nr:peptidoglycan DD-metalloendopeptidase family protein [Halopseudomonas xinjiangensis]SDR92260.1 lipoprotein NlpD [Halopseudomonas xinjiangensis]